MGPDINDKAASSDEDYDDPDEIGLAAHDDDDEEIDSDEAFESGEEELYRKKGFTFKDSGKYVSGSRELISGTDNSSRDDSEDHENVVDELHESSLETGFHELQVDGNSDGEIETMNEDNTDVIMTTDSEGEGGSDTDSNSDVIRAMMATDHRNIVSGLSGAMKSEVDKGVAVKKQYAAFDTLVGTRVHLQKALIAANSLSAVQNTDQKQDSLAKAADAAENAAMEVLNSLSSLLHSIQSAHLGQDESKVVPGKRAFSATISTSSEDIQQAISASHQAFKPQRRKILTRWANKTHSTTLSTRNRLIQKPAEDSLALVLDGQLRGSNQDRLVQKTRIARSCAPLQQAAISQSNKKPTQDSAEDKAMMREYEETSNASSVYDDADFYALLLRELIDHKKSYTKNTPNELSGSTLIAATTPANLLRGNRTKRANLDTKASKGRKMKYTVHEKLQNFMAPIDLGSWERKQAEELFAGLLGRRIAILDEADIVDDVDATEENMEMQGLRLFGDR